MALTLTTHPLKLAKRMQRLGTETAFEVLVQARALEAEGRDIVHLEIGEPDFDTPANIINAGTEALRRGWTHYGPSAGLPQLRRAIAEYVSSTRHVQVPPEEVVVVPGGGCVVVPTGVRFAREDGTHRRVDGDVLARLVDGRTTRPEVVEAVGRQDVELAGGRLWVYSWETSSDWQFAWALFGGMAGGAAGVDEARHAEMHYLVVEFDGADVIRRKGVRHGGFLNGLATGIDDVMRN